MDINEISKVKTHDDPPKAYVKILIIDDNVYVKNFIKNILNDIFSFFKKTYLIEDGNDSIDLIKLVVEDQQKKIL